NEVERHHGLSALGKQAVAHWNDLGVLIDVSQLSSAALEQTLALSRAPVVATHSDPRALIDQTRNLSDAELDAIARKGGVVQLTPFSAYVHTPTKEDLAKVAKVRKQFGLSEDFKSPTDGLASLPEEQREKFYDAYIAASPKGTLKEYVDH